MSRLVRYTWFVLVFNVVVILVGSTVRATGSGAGCGPSWPTCQGEIIPELQGATALEYTHRILSGVALLLVFALVALVWRETSKGSPARRGAALAGIAIVGEALIGAAIVLAEWVADDASVARAISVPLHLVNTLFLLAALALTAHWLAGGRRLDFRADRAVFRWVVLAGTALVLISASGAVTALADTLFPIAESGRQLAEEAHFLTRLRVIHPIIAVFSAVVAWWIAARKGLGRSIVSLAIPILVGGMLVTGALNIALGVPVWMQVVHLGLADALWVSFVLVSARALEAAQPVPVSR